VTISCVPAVVAVTLAAALPGPAGAVGVVGAGRAERPGALDATFGTEGRVVVDLGGELFQDEAATDLAEQADGRVVVAGTAGPDFAQDVVVARFDAAGRLDPTFGDGGRVRTDLGGDSFDVDSASAVAVQRDGRIVVAGGGYLDESTQGVGLVRYHRDGTLDAGFGGDGTVVTDLGPDVDHASDLAVQRDGKLVVAGYTATAAGLVFLVARYLPDGSRDPGFGAGGVVTTNIAAGPDLALGLAVQRDGRLVAVGVADAGSVAGDRGDFALVRYLPDGSIDTGFGFGGRVLTDFAGADDDARAVAVTADGRLAVAGSTEPEWSRRDVAVARYRRDGTLDTRFGTGGRVTTGFAEAPGLENDYAEDLVVQRDGKVVVAGVANDDEDRWCACEGSSGDFGLVRYRRDGSLDPAFGAGGRVTTDAGGGSEHATALVPTRGATVVAAGVAGADPVPSENVTRDFVLARYHLGRPGG
jgi:uncharacterized delta-60 repeat protein